MSKQVGAVVALAGRRTDAPGAAARFPLENIPLVRQRLAEALAAEHATALVSSAACGADLVALEEAERLGIRRRIILPFAPERFRSSSVTDRPGDFGPVFDRHIATVQAAGDLVVMDVQGGSEDDAYAAATVAIIDEALMLARASGTPCRMVAMLVWEGAARSGPDATGEFRQRALAAGFVERSVLTS
jgi:hypothetical protein